MSYHITVILPFLRYILVVHESRKIDDSISDGKDEPKLEHLRDSGEIEQDADVVEFLWHDPDEKHSEGKVIQSIIAKGRDVGVNRFQYLFKGWIQKYEQLA